jgi:hypothetical protein
MPNRFGQQPPKLRAKPKALTSIRHDPAFGIAPQIVRCDSGNSCCRRIWLKWLKYLPYYLLGNAFAADLVSSVNRPQWVYCKLGASGGKVVN